MDQVDNLSSETLLYPKPEEIRIQRNLQKSIARRGQKQYKLLRAPIIHTPVEKDPYGTARIKDLDTKYPIGKHFRTITEIFYSMPYFKDSPPSLKTRTWFNALVKNLNFFPRELVVTLRNDNTKKSKKIQMSVYSWLDTLIRDKAVSIKKEKRRSSWLGTSEKNARLRYR